jgi:hypothetical protein
MQEKSFVDKKRNDSLFLVSKTEKKKAPGAKWAVAKTLINYR